MSRIGRQPISIPEKVSVQVEGSTVKVKGPLGEISRVLPSGIKIERKENVLVLSTEDGAGPETKALHGMSRARMANLIVGAQQGFSKNLDIVGLGFKASLAGEKLTLTLGFSHPIEFLLPKGIQVDIDKKMTKITVKGVDKDLVGQTAARIRGLKPPEPYKGTGIRYEGERILKKAGKTAAGAGAGASGAAGGAKK